MQNPERSDLSILLEQCEALRHHSRIVQYDARLTVSYLRQHRLWLHHSLHSQASTQIQKGWYTVRVISDTTQMQGA